MIARMFGIELENDPTINLKSDLVFSSEKKKKIFSALLPSRHDPLSANMTISCQSRKPQTRIG